MRQNKINITVGTRVPCTPVSMSMMTGKTISWKTYDYQKEGAKTKARLSVLGMKYTRCVQRHKAFKLQGYVFMKIRGSLIQIFNLKNQIYMCTVILFAN